jgi:predicted nicotinamide N-methyase
MRWARGLLAGAVRITSMKRFDAGRFDAFLESATDVVTLPLCPEIRLRVATDLSTLWKAQERWFECVGLAPPYWGIPWPGGQALARFLLDNPSVIRGRSVLDLGSGSGLCAIAAAKGGGVVHAADTDPGACSAIAMNAVLNAVEVTVSREDPMGEPSQWEVVLAADLWYERFMASRVTSWLKYVCQQQTCVLLGDLGRAYFPRSGPVEIGRYRIHGLSAVEQNGVTEACAWRWVTAVVSPPLATQA